MSALRLYVQKPAQRPSPVEADKALILVGDNWNDYSYRTLYTLYYKKNDKIREVGRVKILRRGQRSGDSSLKEGRYQNLQLPKELVSLGTDIDYYLRLRELKLLPRVRTWFNDLSSNPDLAKAFADEEGLKTSLYRYIKRPADYFDEIRRTIAAGGNPPDEDAFTLRFTPAGANEPIAFNLGGVEGSKGLRAARPSRRVGVIIGPNGVGKTQLLARLARVAYAPPAERKELEAEGVIEGDPAFPNIIAVSYSSFDNFAPPALDGDDRDELKADLAEGRGRYAYLGLRDPAGLLDPGTAQPRLRTQDELATAFQGYIERIRELDRFSVFAEIMQPVLEETSFAQYSGIPQAEDEDEFARDEVRERQLEGLLSPDPSLAFLKLSSGHKIVLHQLAGLTAMLQRHGLVLIDEPETHLHPPLLAALMSSIRRLLGRQRAYAIVATHSPVVVQEALAKQVVILAGRDPTIAVPPSIETYGENVGALSREVFGFSPTAGDYRHTLNRMVRQFDTIEDVEEELAARLSSQALAHVVAAFARKAAEEQEK